MGDGNNKEETGRSCREMRAIVEGAIIYVCAFRGRGGRAMPPAELIVYGMEAIWAELSNWFGFWRLRWRAN